MKSYGILRGGLRASCRPPCPTTAAGVRVEALEGRQLFSGLSVTYFDNPDFSGASKSGIDENINFKWPKSPATGIDHDTFSARWTGSVRAGYSEKYTFTVAADDGARLWVDGQLLVDRWSSKRAFTASGSVTLEAGKLYDIKVEYRQNVKAARISLKWRSPSLRRAQVIPTTMLYPPSTPSTPDVASVVPDGSVSQVANVRDFGATGDGVHDDAPAIQAAIDALPAYGTLELEPRTYKLDTGLQIHKPLNIDGNGGLLLLNTSAYPDNHQLFISSTLNPANAVQWTENVTAGQSTFHVASAPGQFTVGQWVFVQLGQDPNDPNEENFSALTQVSAVTTDTISVFATVPYDINNGVLAHRITPVDQLASDVHVRDLKFDHVDGTVPDASIYVWMAKDVSVDGVSGRFNMVVNVADSSTVDVSNVVASLVHGHSAAGRVLTAWQSNDVRVTNVKADTAIDTAVFYVESWSRNTTFRNIDVRWRYAKRAENAVFHFTGDSSGTFADQVRIDNAGPVMLVGSGGQSAKYSFGTVSITGPVRTAPLYLTDDLTIGKQRYAQVLHSSQTITLESDWQDHRVPLVTGTIRAIKVTATDGSAVTRLFLLNAALKGGGFEAPFASGDVLDYSGLLGDDNPLNDAADSLKTVALYTADTVAPGTTLTIDVDYYPPIT